jgi:pimeloyl-ACP methyl ester carboxylesterase
VITPIVTESPAAIEHHDASLGEVTLHYVTAGDGAPVVLLHGFPQTWFAWRLVMPALAERYRVIAPDLRGLGDSSRPAAGYDKTRVAGDVWELVHGTLGYDSFFLVGHDWGGPVAYALATAHREAVRRLAVLDVVIPGDGTDHFATSQGRWHHAFHRTPDLPEALIEGRERLYIAWFLKTFTAHPGAIPDAAIDEYARTYSQPGAMRAALGYYRSTPQDIADNRRSIAEGKLAMPVLALGGGESFGRRELTLDSLRRVAADVRGGVIEGSGHFIPEEKPAELAAALLDFLAGS